MNSRTKNKPNPSPTRGKQLSNQAQAYSTINEAVHEYLLKSGLFRTVDTFIVWANLNTIARIDIRKIYHRSLHR